MTHAERPDMNAIIPAASATPALTEATVQDLRLAELLGYERPTNIRNLIHRHAATLKAMGPLLHREAMVAIGSGAMRSVTEYHLTRAQAAFIVAKAGTKHADSLTAKMAEVFALYNAGGLVAVNPTAEAELAAIEERERQRRRALHEEERAGRDSAFAALRGGNPSRATLKRKALHRRGRNAR